MNLLNKVKNYIFNLLKITSDNTDCNQPKSSLDEDINIFDLKKEYEHVFKTEIMGETFIFRPLNKYEYFELIVQETGVPHEILVEEICKMCTLYPSEYNFENPNYAGIPESLFKTIKEYSGFTNHEMIKDIASTYRDMNENDFDHQMENIIMTAFPSIRLEEMQEWSIYKLIDYFARAEWVVENMMVQHQKPNKDEGQAQQQAPQQAQMQQKLKQGMGSNFRKNQ